MPRFEPDHSTGETGGGLERATPSAEFCGRKYATSPENWQRQSECPPKNGPLTSLRQQSLPLSRVKGNKFGVWETDVSVSNRELWVAALKVAGPKVAHTTARFRSNHFQLLAKSFPPLDH